ncbi:MAG: translation initiation factor IF-3 [Candidatus Andersenbacteria bacterium]|nr:translation initiation factor IF-3 [Candidatus Andersenbacteria bacterium]
MPARRRRFRSRPKPQVKKPPANEEIRAVEIRLVGPDGAQLGVVSREAALHMAKEQGYDLVVVAEKTTPPVVRMMDLGKFMYEKRKKDAKQKSNSKGGEIKGVRIGLKTDDHDWNFRLSQAAGFFADGNKVKLEIRLRGREKQRFDLAEKKVREFVDQIPGGAKIEDSISRAHNGLSVVVTKK